jgi:predicted solute-binding protein
VIEIAEDDLQVRMTRPLAKKASERGEIVEQMAVAATKIKASYLQRLKGQTARLCGLTRQKIKYYFMALHLKLGCAAQY